MFAASEIFQRSASVTVFARAFSIQSKRANVNPFIDKDAVVRDGTRPGSKVDAVIQLWRTYWTNRSSCRWSLYGHLMEFYCNLINLNRKILIKLYFTFWFLPKVLKIQNFEKLVSPVWSKAWFRKLVCLLKPLLHTSHLKGHEPLCTYMWDRRSPGVGKDFVHCVHLCGFTCMERDFVISKSTSIC